MDRSRQTVISAQVPVRSRTLEAFTLQAAEKDFSKHEALGECVVSVRG